MDKTLIFWIIVGGHGFVFALAVQMRVMIALVLRRALSAWRPAFDDRDAANAAVMLAASQTPSAGDATADIQDAADYLKANYPNPLGHLRRARRYSVISPILLLAVLALGRTVLGVI